MNESFEKKLCSILIAKSIITPKEALDLQKDFQERVDETFDDFLLNQDIIARDVLLNALSELYEVQSFDVIGHFFKHDLLLHFPKEFLLRHAIIPLEQEGDILVIVANNPEDAECLAEIGEYVPDDIRFLVGIGQDIVEAIEEYYDESPFVPRDEEDLSQDSYEEMNLADEIVEE